MFFTFTLELYFFLVIIVHWMLLYFSDAVFITQINNINYIELRNYTLV